MKYLWFSGEIVMDYDLLFELCLYWMRQRFRCVIEVVKLCNCIKVFKDKDEDFENFDMVDIVDDDKDGGDGVRL